MMVSKLVAVLLLFSVVDGPTSGSTQDDITAKVGDTVILPAHLQTPLDLSKLRIIWTYEDRKDRFVYEYHNEKIMDQRQLVNYQGRASLNLSEIANGTFSLKLTNVTLRDAGQYSLILHNKNLRHNRAEIKVSLKIENITGDPTAPSHPVPPEGLWMTSPPTEPDQKTETRKTTQTTQEQEKRRELR
ncbi:butyrophilin-like protein 10 isoform X2 [Labrus bergylta]|uniref:butyrophilin-like protein 10 isoform X2 n=1 Tax=Labrus bergylta TaxID=56723 RepID=UPI0033142916